MLTYTGGRNLFGNLVNNTSSNTLTTADPIINEMHRKVCSSRQWPFLERQYTVSTDSANQFVTLPFYADRLYSVYVTVGSIRYTPEEVTSRDQWDRLNLITIASDIPTHWYPYDGKVGLFPKPSTSGNTITLNSKRMIKDLTIADYTTGTITTTSTVSGVTTVTGSGTTWNAQMAGRFLQITDGNTTGTGDGFWYEIAAVASTTSLTLVRPYAGTALSVASATYVIGQCQILPEPYQALPIYMALQVYFNSIDPDQGKSSMYGQLAKDTYQMLLEDYGDKTGSVVIDPGYEHRILNPNLTITL